MYWLSAADFIGQNEFRAEICCQIHRLLRCENEVIGLLSNTRSMTSPCPAAAAANGRRVLHLFEEKVSRRLQMTHFAPQQRKGSH